MDILSQSIRTLETMLLHNISQQEDKQIALLKEERKKLEAIAAEARVGVSFYGSYFTNSSQ